MPLTKLPPQIHTAPTNITTPQQAAYRLRSYHRYGIDWVLRDRAVISFQRLDKSPYDVLCSGPSTTVATDEWAQSDDPETLYWFVRLLNVTFREILHKDVVWSTRHKYVYFRPIDGQLERVESSKTRVGRRVITAYASRKDPASTHHFRHVALRFHFLRIDGAWHLALRPDYHFTSDGHRESGFADRYRSGIKRLERNAAVRGLVEFWALWLTRPVSLLHEPDERMAFAPLVHIRLEAPDANR